MTSVVTNLSGDALVIPGDNIDTDVLYPGKYLNITDPEEMKNHLFEGMDSPLKAEDVTPGCFLVVEENFGTGSSREHVVLSMKALGVSCVIGKSLAKIFYRNCLNLGLPALTCREAVEASQPGSAMEMNLEAGSLTVDGREFFSTPMPRFMKDLVSSGGLIEWGKTRIGQDRAT